MDIIHDPWPWYFAGPMISLVMYLLLWAGERFGVSSTLSTWCTIGGAGSKFDYFKIDLKKNIWGIVLVIGAVIGGVIASNYMINGQPLSLSQSTINHLDSLGIPFEGDYIPLSIFSWDNLFTRSGIICIMLGGFFVGFGTRWAGGCTSGHAISGISNFQSASVIAVIGFFIGGLISTHLLMPLIFFR